MPKKSRALIMNSFASLVLGIDGLTFSAIVIRIKFKLSLLDRSQASYKDFSSSELASVMAAGFSSTMIDRSRSITPS
ncbi:hypothetical protein Syun_002006 [Stephania yunnanensis]|uniref:Uncharacterized protein n=1 Tax=Stephania yunnanensis TaxID=152371 RepID=A0AAP0LEZ8_9MAGN